MEILSKRWWPIHLTLAGCFVLVALLDVGAWTFPLLAAFVCGPTLALWRWGAFRGARILVFAGGPRREARRCVRLAPEPRGTASLSPRKVMEHALLPFALSLALGAAVASWLVPTSEGGVPESDIADFPATFLLIALFGGILGSILAPVVWIVKLSKLRSLDERTGATDPLDVPPMLSRFTWVTAIIAVVKIASLAPVESAIDRGLIAFVTALASVVLVYPVMLISTFVYLVLMLDKDVERLHAHLGAETIPDVYSWRRDAVVASPPLAVATSDNPAA